MNAQQHRAFALRGVVDGRSLLLPLCANANLLGSAASCNLRLNVAGISKRHALLHVHRGKVSIEDLASKNGTFVNRQRIDHAPLEPGDQLAFGVLSMVLEQIDADETRMAIDLGLPEQPTSRPVTTETRTAPSVASGGGVASLGLAIGFVTDLGQRDAEAPLSSAVQALAGRLPLRGLCLFAPLDTTAGTELAFLASAGPLAAIDVKAVSAAVARSADGAWLETHLDAAHADAGPMLLMVAPPGRHGLLAWGDRMVSAEVRALLRLVLALTDQHGHREPTPESIAPSVMELVFPEGHVVGESSAMVSFYQQIQPVVHSDLPVLVLGETGTGKESVAQIIHGSSKRCRKPLVTLNCAAMPQDLIEAELFGIGVGVATGVAARTGKFQEAHESTLFLDEIGDLPLGLQAKLLRALQDGDIRPLGRQPVRVDVRIVAATNSDLEAKMQAGLFRRDLYYRLAGLVVHVPPLRQRIEDLPLLVTHFLRCEAQKAGKAIRGLTVGAMKQLSTQRWPGNVRELEHEVRRLVHVAGSNQVISGESITAATASGSSAESIDFRTVPSLDLGEIEKSAVQEALRRAEGRVTEAARMLGITRQALRRRMSRHGLG